MFHTRLFPCYLDRLLYIFRKIKNDLLYACLLCFNFNYFYYFFFLEFFRNFYASFWFCYAPLYVRYKTLYTEWTLSASLGWLVHTLKKIQKWCMILKIYELFANYLILCINELYFLSIKQMLNLYVDLPQNNCLL